MADWRILARRAVLTGRPFVEDDGLVWLSVDRCHEADLMPLASLAECGHSECACTRSRFPWVRRRFREEVTRRAVAARASGTLSSSISYVGLGSGLLLGDLDVIMALQDEGFTIANATFVDSDYREHCHGALAEMADYLAPSRVKAYTSAADYALARMRGIQPAAQLFLQIDVTEIAFEEAALLSTLALDDAGGGMGFMLSNRYHDTLVPMVCWQRLPTPAPGDDVAHGCLAERLVDRLLAAHMADRDPPPHGLPAAMEARSPDSADRLLQAADAEGMYARARQLLSTRPLIAVDKQPIERGPGEQTERSG